MDAFLEKFLQQLVVPAKRQMGRLLMDQEPSASLHPLPRWLQMVFSSPVQGEFKFSLSGQPSLVRVGSSKFHFLGQQVNFRKNLTEASQAPQTKKTSDQRMDGRSHATL
ncbi:hypothetical protein AVEN_115725-1 [Araneus ventricosus]|uniref:Uncharacterized protein n=1 Tax=Araneus ventricosus TaxID=182803 RepID=A0A4Y2VL09_ARAVE|nr:hypothetical protein AVEN_115725-1 [Araneus ventricosus]